MRDRGSSSCLLQLILGLLIVLGAMLVLGVAPGDLLQRVPGRLPGQAARQQQELNAGTIRQALPRNRLETTTMVIDQLIEGKVEGNVLQNLLFSDRLLLQVRGEVIAGVDMSKLRDQDIVVQGQSVTITLPPSEILASRLDNQGTYVYQRDTGLLTNGDPNLETQARQYADSQLLPAACQQEVLQEAATRARENVTDLLRMLGFQQITVNAPIGECEG